MLCCLLRACKVTGPDHAQRHELYGTSEIVTAQRDGGWLAVDSSKDLVMAFSNQGHFITDFARGGSKLGGPRGIRVDADGRIVVAYPERVQVFGFPSSSGASSEPLAGASTFSFALDAFSFG